jgi:hypothetical protein
MHARPMTRLILVVLILTTAAWTTPAKAQALRVAPQPGYQFVDVRTQGPFEVQRWVAAAAPDVSPAGICNCLIVVYEGARRVVTLGSAGDLTAITIDSVSGRDINGDRFPELVATSWSGGAHCCYSTTVYSVGRDIRNVLAVQTGNCGPGTFDDLDGDKVLEFTTCYDQWADTYCDFASAPMPTVVFAYDPTSRRYQVATPRFSSALQRLIDGELAEARTALTADGGKDPGAEKCLVLRPALDLMYTGRLGEGVALIRGLYRGADLETFVQHVTSQTRLSPLWKGAP